MVERGEGVGRGASTRYGSGAIGDALGAHGDIDGLACVSFGETSADLEDSDGDPIIDSQIEMAARVPFVINAPGTGGVEAAGRRRRPHRLLDRESLAVVDLERFPPIPSNLGLSRLQVSVRLGFALRRSTGGGAEGTAGRKPDPAPTVLARLSSGG